MNELNFYNERKLDKSNSWLMFLLLGWSYGSMGSMGKQIFFYLTGAGVGLWFLYVLFTLNSKIKKYNLEVAREVGLSNDEIAKLGLY